MSVATADVRTRLDVPVECVRIAAISSRIDGKRSAGSAAIPRTSAVAIGAGKLGGGVSIEDGAKAAQACAINLLAQIKAALGDLDKVTRVVRLGGFINSAPDFVDGPKVMNGASDLMVTAFGDKGRHARTTIGVAALPIDAAVEVEGTFEVS